MNKGEMPAGQELDALVAKKVMEWTPGIECVSHGQIKVWKDKSGNVATSQEDWGPANDITCTRWSPSTDIAAAWQVVEKMGMQCGYSIHNREPFAMYGGFSMVAKTVPLAICRLALKAIRERGGYAI